MWFLPWVAELFSKGGGTSARQKIHKILWFALATVTSQALKYDVITYTPYEGLSYTILDKLHHYENVSVSLQKIK